MTAIDPRMGTLQVATISRYALYAFVLSTPFVATAVYNVRAVSFGLQPSYLFGIVLVSLWVLHMMTGKNIQIRLNRTDKTVAALLFVVILSFMNSAFIPDDYLHILRERPVSVGIKQTVYVLFLTLNYFALRHWMNKTQVLHGCLRVYIWTSLFVSLYGFYLYVAQQGVLPYWAPLNNNISFAQGLHYAVPRVTGVLPEPSYFSNYILSVIAILLFLILKKDAIYAKPIYLGILLIDLLALFLSGSRIGYASLIVVFLLVSLFSRGTRRDERKLKMRLLSTVLLLSLVLGSVVFAFDREEYVVQRFLSGVNLLFDPSTADHSSTERWEGFRGGVLTFLEHPVLGVGWGNYPFYHYFHAPLIDDPFPGTYSFLSKILAELGLLGFLVFALLVALVLRLRTGRGPANRHADNLLGALKLSFFSVIISAALGVPSILVFMHFWLILVMTVSCHELYTSQRKHEVRTLS